jgi:hypothetical protein
MVMALFLLQVPKRNLKWMTVLLFGMKRGILQNLQQGGYGSEGKQLVRNRATICLW